MKIAFVGPSLAGHDVDWGDIAVRPPASQGDIFRAVMNGAEIIGLIDGHFDGTAAVWHKEILFALERGVRVLGGASMGALRAAECAAFGMEAVGTIANAYLDGTFDDDGLVAICHAPAELGFAPVTEALVDVLATIRHLREIGAISAAEAATLRDRAETLHFTERTREALLAALPEPRATEVTAAYDAHAVAVKRADALEVVARLRAESVEKTDGVAGWTMNVTPTWASFVAGDGVP